MYDEEQARIKAGIGLGLLGQFIGSFMTLGLGGPYAQHGLAFWAAGTVLLIWGCSALAARKGYAKFLGILGFASFIGVIFLALLPYRRTR